MLVPATIIVPAGILGLLLIILIVWLALEVSMRIGGSVLGLIVLILLLLWLF